MLIPILVSLVSVSASPVSAMASTNKRFDALRCYSYAIPSMGAHDAKSHSETWCYGSFESSGTRFEKVFPAERPESPELSALIEWSADGEIRSVTHASRAAGELSYHRLQSPGAFSPLPVPLVPSEKSGAVKVDVPARLRRGTLRLDRADALNGLLEAQTDPLREITIREGRTASMLPTERLPWRGYWWPGTGLPLSSGPNAPLAKYDRLMTVKTGTNPSTSFWEALNHAYQNVSWAGHCNGWAASSILYPEPRRPVRDAQTGLEFSISDLKGLLSETAFCVKYAMYGIRYNGPNDSLKDIDPVLFTQVLIHYIDHLKKPLIIELAPNTSIENQVATGFVLNATRSSRGPGEYDVHLLLRTHNYDPERNESTGPAPEFFRNFRYTLKVDPATGRLEEGTWQSLNPDFLWVPLVNELCGDENPNVEEAPILELLKQAQ